jgi:hypothetical protein
MRVASSVGAAALRSSNECQPTTAQGLGTIAVGALAQPEVPNKMIAASASREVVSIAGSGSSIAYGPERGRGNSVEAPAAERERDHAREILLRGKQCGSSLSRRVLLRAVLREPRERCERIAVGRSRQGIER